MNHKIITVSGPSLSGKTEFTKILSQHDFNTVISSTTRPKRGLEENGKDYYFLTDNEFDSTKFIQTTNFNNFKYGVSEQEVTTKLNKHLLWVIAPESVKQVEKFAEKNGIEVIKLFITNPNEVIFERLFERFKNDKNADPLIYSKRLSAMLNDELKWGGAISYDYIIKEFNKENTLAVLNDFLEFLNKEHSNTLGKTSIKSKKP